MLLSGWALLLGDLAQAKGRVAGMPCYAHLDVVVASAWLVLGVCGECKERE